MPPNPPPKRQRNSRRGNGFGFSWLVCTAFSFSPQCGRGWATHPARVQTGAEEALLSQCLMQPESPCLDLSKKYPGTQAPRSWPQSLGAAGVRLLPLRGFERRTRLIGLVVGGRRGHGVELLFQIIKLLAQVAIVSLQGKDFAAEDS